MITIDNIFEQLPASKLISVPYENGTGYLTSTYVERGRERKITVFRHDKDMFTAVTTYEMRAGYLKHDRFRISLHEVQQRILN